MKKKLEIQIRIPPLEQNVLKILVFKEDSKRCLTLTSTPREKVEFYGEFYFWNRILKNSGTFLFQFFPVMRNDFIRLLSEISGLL